MPPAQTPAQLAAAESAAGLNATQKSGVAAGTGYSTSTANSSPAITQPASTTTSTTYQPGSAPATVAPPINAVIPGGAAPSTVATAPKVTAASQPIPANLYQSVRASIQNGTMTPQQGQQYLQSYISNGTYSGSVDTGTLFAPLSITQSGQTYQLNPDGTFKNAGATVNNASVSGSVTTNTTNTPGGQPTFAQPSGATASAAPISSPSPGNPGYITTDIPGSNATDLYEYYTAKGQTLPTVAQSANTFASLGLGTKESYTGTASQNEELLQALQLKDHAQTTIGSSDASQSANAGAAAMSATPAGASLASVLSGTDAATTLSNYQTYLSTQLGAAQAQENGDQNALTSFFSNEQDPTQILQDAMDSAGVTAGNSVLSELDSQIAAQTTTLNNLPADIRSTLADAGVSQAQLDRLTAAETKGPTQVLNDLMTKRNATQTEINTATSYAEKFANTKIAAQAAKLAALQWQVTTDKSEYSALDADAKTVITNAINDQKTIQTTALTAAKNGASASVVDAILSSGSGSAAIQTAGASLVAPKKTAASTTMTSDITSAASAFSVGIPSKGYNGVGSDGYVDPNLYTALYNQALSQYGPSGAQAFLVAYPPTGGGKFAKGIKGINPAATTEGILPAAVQNLVMAGALNNSGSGTGVQAP